MTRTLKLWLLTCMSMVVLMVFIGGVTRLTESGLSIVEWKLVTGILPPLTQEGWEAELQLYRASPEYQQINRGMSVSEFKQIFWLEWLHRLLGRLTGLVFAVPLIYFAARKLLPNPMGKQMLIACLLVGAQGTLGWLMVYSGLQQDPRVSPLRLAAHLSLAFGLFCYLYWLWLSHTQTPRASGPAVPIRIITALIALQIIFGAFVAGMDAGLVYNTWPLMDGDWMPPYTYPAPWLESLYSHVPSVQWQHRSFAYIVAAAILGFVALNWRSGERKWLTIFAAILLIQFALGVFTLLYTVPITLASAHQIVALALLATAVRLCYAYPLRSQKIARID